MDPECRASASMGGATQVGFETHGAMRSSCLRFRGASRRSLTPELVCRRRTEESRICNINHGFQLSPSGQVHCNSRMPALGAWGRDWQGTRTRDLHGRPASCSPRNVAPLRGWCVDGMTGASGWRRAAPLSLWGQCRWHRAILPTDPTPARRFWGHGCNGWWNWARSGQSASQ